MTILGPNPRDVPLVNNSEPSKGQDDQINYFDHLDHLDETKDLAANMAKLIHNRQAESLRSTLLLDETQPAYNRANRGNRKVTYHAYRAFRALFFNESGGTSTA
jgi:hypothetical protein